jgi:hypothetical protein
MGRNSGHLEPSQAAVKLTREARIVNAARRWVTGGRLFRGRAMGFPRAAPALARSGPFFPKNIYLDLDIQISAVRIEVCFRFQQFFLQEARHGTDTLRHAALGPGPWK